MPKIAVIGSNSFSGAYFVDLLLENRANRVIGIDRATKGQLFLPYLKRRDLEQFEFHRFDLNFDMDALCALLQAEQPEYIVNFAAQSEVAPSWEHPDQWYQTNVVALTRLANYLKDMPFLKRYVHISSPEVYGTCEGIVREDAPFNPSSPYAASKAAGDMSLFTFYKNWSFPLVVMRATNVYGAYQQLFKIIPRTIIYLKLGKVIPLHGGGVAVKSYIHMKDVARGYLAGMLQGVPGQIYHLSPDDSGVAVIDVMRQVCELTGHEFHRSVQVMPERLGQDMAYVIDSSKARREFQWQPAISLRQGLINVVQWVNEHWETIQSQPLEYIHQP